MDGDAPAPLQRDRWLESFLGKPCYRLRGVDIGTFLRAPPDLDVLGPSFIAAAASAQQTDHVDALRAMPGFRLADTSVTLFRPPALSPEGNAGTFTVRLAVSQDRGPVEMIAGASFRWDRFHQDPLVPDQAADALKAAWAGNFFTGQRGDWMVVAEAGGRPVGFLQLLRAPREELVIDLTATTEAWRGRGIGRSMIAFAASRLPCGGGIRVGTQAANTASLRLYEALGFRRVGASCVFHRHGPGKG